MRSRASAKPRVPGRRSLAFREMALGEYWYDGALEVLVKGEEYLGGEEPESLINID